MFHIPGGIEWWQRCLQEYLFLGVLQSTKAGVCRDTRIPGGTERFGTTQVVGVCRNINIPGGTEAHERVGVCWDVSHPGGHRIVVGVCRNIYSWGH